MPRLLLALALLLPASLAAVGAARAQDLFGFGNNADQAQRRQAELNLKIQQLEGQMRQLNGQLEQLTFSIRQLQETMGRMQKDYEFRIQELENAGAGAGRAKAAPPKRTELQPAPSPPSGGVPVAAPPGQATLEDDDDGPLAAPGPGPSPPRPIGPAQAAGVAPGGYPRAGPGAPPAVIGQIPASEDPIGGVIGRGGPLDLSARPGVPPPASDLPPGVNLGPAAPQRSAGVPTVPPRYQNVPPVASPRDEYDAAYGYILNGEYELAETSFRTFLANHPTDRRIGNAQYWLGESFYARSMFREAADAFLKSYTQFPDGAKAPDSLLKLGLSLQGLGERKAACATYDELVVKYPKASKQLRDRAQAEKVRAKC
ncbi:tol-pal system protein YbgF [Prosthecomicrobium sp. N25]|uniref:tol-pal system protein YbgF n=1 Tax=Prosthecomicrobium sp. N25 TaxID=3129254 RepID=UPI003077BF2A